MSGLGFASAACALSCPYGVTQWATDVNSGGTAAGSGYITGGFAWPRFVYSSALPQNPSTAVGKEVPDGTQRDARVGRLRAAGLTTSSLYATAGSMIRTVGLGGDTVLYNVGATSPMVLGIEDSGTTVLLQNLNGNTSAFIQIPVPSPATDGWSCRIQYGQQCGGNGALLGFLVLSSLWSASQSTLQSRQGNLQFAATWGGSPQTGGQNEIPPGGQSTAILGQGFTGPALNAGDITKTGYAITVRGRNGVANGTSISTGATVEVKLFCVPQFSVVLVTVDIPVGGYQAGDPNVVTFAPTPP